MKQRNQLSLLAKTDFSAALELATSMAGTRERIQSLGWVLRYAPAKQVPSVLDSALDVARSPHDDYYEPAMALAWPLRALHETDNASLMPATVSVAVELARNVSPTSSRAECLILLLQAAFPAGMRTVDPVIDTLLTHCAGDDHWRVVRAFVDAALFVNGVDADRAHQIAELIPDGKKRRASLARLDAGEKSEPRQFFW